MTEKLLSYTRNILRIIILFITILFVLYYIALICELSFLNDQQPSLSRFLTIESQNAQRDWTFRSKLIKRNTQIGSEGVPIRIKDTLMTYDKMKKGLISERKFQEIQERCFKMTELERLKDSECRAEWMFLLTNGTIVEISDFLGFAHSKKGGIIIKFEDGRKAMLKPCGSYGEQPEMEIIASSLDFILGNDKVAPVMSRNINTKDFKEMVDNSTNLEDKLQGDFKLLKPIYKRKDQLFSETVQYCSKYQHTVIFSAVIGWWSNVEDYHTIPKRFIYGTNETAASNLHKTMDPIWAATTTNNHIYLYLLDILRKVGYNEYRIKEDGSSTLIALDLDRGHFNHFTDPYMQELTICYLCKVFKSDYDLLSQLSEYENLDALINHVLSFDLYPVYFSKQNAKILFKRISSLVNCFNQCSSIYGPENVFVYN